MLDVIKQRRSCRSYSSKPVEDEKIKEIIEAGLAAPSGMNRQTPVIIAIKDKKTRDALAEIAANLRGREKGDDPYYGAPVILFVLANKNGLSMQDGAATMENMLLEATHQGLRSCWVHFPEPEILREDERKLLSFTGLNFDEYIGVGHVILGYNDEPVYREKTINEGRYFIK